MGGGEGEGEGREGSRFKVGLELTGERGRIAESQFIHLGVAKVGRGTSVCR
jgi:hypothetical protein